MLHISTTSLILISLRKWTVTCICNLFFCFDTGVNWVGPVSQKWWCMAPGKYSVSDVTRLFNSKCVTAWGCQADHLKPCVWWWQRPPIVLGFDLGPDECSPHGADVDTRSAMSARAKHSRDSEVRGKKKWFSQISLCYEPWSCTFFFFFTPALVGCHVWKYESRVMLWSTLCGLHHNSKVKSSFRALFYELRVFESRHILVGWMLLCA